MRVLFVSFSDPLDPGGIENQARGLVRALVARGHGVGCLTVGRPGDADTFRQKLLASGLFPLGCRVLPWAERAYPARAKLGFWTAASPTRYLAGHHPELVAAYAGVLHDCCRAWGIDVIHCLGLRTTYYLPPRLPAALVCDLVDSVTLRKRRALGVSLRDAPRDVPRDLVDYLKTRRIERDVLRRFRPAPVAVVSAADAGLLRRLSSGADVHVVPHPIDYGPGATGAPAGEKALAFWGFLEQGHNLDALRVLHDRVWPAVRSRHPDATLHITGINLHDGVRRLDDPGRGVRVWPTVRDLPAFIARAALTCWPFRCGSGVKNKILEAMAYGKPVVSTELGVEWLPAAHRGGVRVADTAAELARHVAELLDDPAECRRLGEINRAVLRDHYSWDQKAEAYLGLYATALAGPGTVTP